MLLEESEPPLGSLVVCAPLVVVVVVDEAVVPDMEDAPLVLDVDAVVLAGPPLAEDSVSVPPEGMNGVPRSDSEQATTPQRDSAQLQCIQPIFLTNSRLADRPRARRPGNEVGAQSVLSVRERNRNGDVPVSACRLVPVTLDR